MTRRLALAALAAAIAFGPAACSSGGSAQPSASPTQNSVQKNLAAAKRFADCARNHGHPAFPDPVIEHDRVSFPASQAGGANRKAEIAALESVPECKAILAEMNNSSRPSTPIPGADVVQKLRRFAQCIRQHGVPAWPDPKSDGTFPVSGTTIGDPKTSPQVRTAMAACEQYVPGTENFGQFS
jgi:hypothetical protein